MTSHELQSIRGLAEDNLMDDFDELEARIAKD